MRQIISIFCGLTLVLFLTACEKKSSEPAPQAGSAPASISSAAPPVAPSATPVSGKVVETMNASGYTYLLVENEAGQKWVAVNESAVNVGEEVSYIDGMVMQNFYSKTLDRTFPEIIFSGGLVGKTPGLTEAIASLPAGAAEATGSFSDALSKEGAAALGGAAEALTSGSSKAVVPFAEIKVEKAAGDNGYTVAEIFAKSTDLNGKKIVVKGKVMKVSPKIMGRNWLHIQDGTGSESDKTHDLVVTTSQEPDNDWDVVTVEGTLAANKDFGAGYSYVVIIEDAAITK